MLVWAYGVIIGIFLFCVAIERLYRMIGRHRNWLVKSARIVVLTANFPEGGTALVDGRIVGVSEKFVTYAALWDVDGSSIDLVKRVDEGITWVRGSDPSPLVAVLALTT